MRHRTTNHVIEVRLKARQQYLHKLFDRGYLTVTPDYRVEVSAKIREQFENGREYYIYHGRQLAMLPQSVNEQPNRNFLEWHNTEVYQG